MAQALASWSEPDGEAQNSDTMFDLQKINGLEIYDVHTKKELAICHPLELEKHRFLPYIY